jgi:4-amino-4-deoxy-L-arabinose transferase-like glycosyltransferase
VARVRGHVDTGLVQRSASQALGPEAGRRAGAAWHWVFLAFLFAAVRVNEPGIGFDPSLYASISRSLARHGHWWSPSASAHVFPQFAEHPFLGLWIQGLAFTFLPANDVTVRLVPLLF